MELTKRHVALFILETFSTYRGEIRRVYGQDSKSYVKSTKHFRKLAEHELQGNVRSNNFFLIFGIHVRFTTVRS